MSDRGAAARAMLAHLGLDPEAPAAERVATLLGGPDRAPLLDALVDTGTDAVAAVLARLEATVPDRTTRKDLRRALYRLRQRGVAVPEPEPAPVRARPLGEELEAFITGFAGEGDRLIWLVKPLVEGGSLAVYGHIHEPRGLLDLSVGEVGRKRLREVRQRLEADTGLRFAAVDWRIADALLVEAEERHGPAEGRPSYLRTRGRLTTAPPAPAAEPVSKRVTPPTADEAAALVAGSATLLAEPELLTWHPAMDDSKRFVEELGEARESPIVLSQGAQEERVRDIIGRAVHALAPAEPLARRLAGTAYVLAETGRSAVARQALAVVAALRDRPAGGADVPFVVAFVERVLGQLMAADTARKEEERRGSLVMTPGQFLKDRSSSRPTRTRG